MRPYRVGVTLWLGFFHNYYHLTRMPPVEQSDGAGSNNKKRGIFSVDGASVVFSFHKSVTEGARDVLFTKIEVTLTFVASISV